MDEKQLERVREVLEEKKADAKAASERSGDEQPSGSEAGGDQRAKSSGQGQEDGRQVEPVADRFLAIYMNDQLALGIVWREIARRAQTNNDGTEFGDALAGVATQIAEDVATFEGIMDRLGIARSPVKPRLAVVGERLGRLKPNGQVTGYSPLSRFVELDFLRMGIDGKVVLWHTLRDLAGISARLPDIDFDDLIERARRQSREIEPFRAQAGRDALAA